MTFMNFLWRTGKLKQRRRQSMKCARISEHAVASKCRKQCLSKVFKRLHESPAMSWLRARAPMSAALLCLWRVALQEHQEHEEPPRNG